MRDEQYLTVGINPIMPALGNSATGSGSVKKDNVSDTLARLSRVRDEKHLSLADRPDAGTTRIQASADSGSGADSDQEDYSFSDLIDILNPLQHIPGVSTVYRDITGDEISPTARIAGASLFLGPLGAAGTLFDLGVEAVTGNTMGEHVLGLFDDDSRQDPVVVATNTVGTDEAGGTDKTGAIDATNSVPVSTPLVPPLLPDESADMPVQESVLSPTEAFTFAPQPAISDPSLQQTPPLQTSGETTARKTAEPVAPDPVPSDIFTGLYSGPSAPDPVAVAAVNDTPSRLNPPSDLGMSGMSGNSGGNGPGGATLPDPIANPLISADMVARAYDSAGGASYSAPDTGVNTLSDTMGHRAALASTLMPEAVSRYEHSAALQRPAHGALMDVRN